MVYVLIITMAVVTYLIRVIPLTLVRGEIKNKFLKNFLYYVPYACLTSMTFPAILYATNSIISALAGFVAAVVFALMNKSLLMVAAVACIAVFVVELFV